MAQIMLKLDREEVRQLPYGVICMTRYGAAWNTGKRKRLWKELFTEQEREAAAKIFSQCHRFLLTSGPPEELVMSLKTRALWDKLANFCASI